MGKKLEQEKLVRELWSMVVSYMTLVFWVLPVSVLVGLHLKEYACQQPVQCLWLVGFVLFIFNLATMWSALVWSLNRLSDWWEIKVVELLTQMKTHETNGTY